ncbi:MAG: hypothetical protein ACRDTC_05430 [Pseudonocardiaceae bacterium]
MYRVTTDIESAEQVSALPVEAFAGYIAVVGVLELVPWNGRPYIDVDPDGRMRQWVFGPRSEGLVTYMILEDQQRVDVLKAQ